MVFDMREAEAAHIADPSNLMSWSRRSRNMRRRGCDELQTRHISHVSSTSAAQTACRSETLSLGPWGLSSQLGPGWRREIQQAFYAKTVSIWQSIGAID